MKQVDPAVASERVAAIFKQLGSSANNLNTASDELGKSVLSIESALKRLNLGISAWVKIVGHVDDEGYFDYRYLGYDKVGSTWGVAIKTDVGHEADPDGGKQELWLFGDAPRKFRLEAVDRLPELLEELLRESEAAATAIKQKSVFVTSLASAILPTITRK